METILIIDDDTLVQKLLARLLQEHYQVSLAGSGEQGLELVEQIKPNIILLDIEMPGMNGYEVCAALRRIPCCATVPVIFLSSRSSVKERLKGYEVGGDDYLPKPFEEKELLAKVKLLVEYSVERQQLKACADSAQATAVEAMATSFELGKSVRFVEQSYFSKGCDQLAAQLLNFCSDLELSAALMIKTRRGPHFYSSTQGSAAPLEQEILALLHSNQRFVDFGQRTQVNFKQVALLVKNMPKLNSSRYGRIKDVLPFVLGAADAKTRVLDAERALGVQRAELGASIATVNMSLETLSEAFNRSLEAVSSTMSALIAQLSFELRNMGMDADQEEWVLDKVEAAASQISECIEGNVNAERVLADVLSLLKKITSEQDRILRESLKSDSLLEHNSAQDIELF
ncbi:response regulator [Agaribacterium haliotis]|uniref:response regulator n=1 Tax=Agaribacterium haliotis TaxID=2013869 RepID=UPI000BB55C4D|nr:response regulator [Agaribacterium haliotis]